MNAPPRSHFVSRVGLALVVAAALTLGGLWLMRGRAADAADESKGREQSDSEPIAVKVLRPRKDPTFRLGVEQPAYVAAYYTADLKARVAGPVKAVYCDIGSRVKANDTLLKVDVPDLEEDVLQKQALIEQRTRELELARTNIATASAAADAAQATVKVKQSDVESTAATRRFREKEMKRFKALVEGKDPGVTPDVYDERVQFYESAVAAESAARATVIKAQADFTEAQAKVEAAKADVTLKDSLVAVARKDKDLAAALLSYATLKAPFDGVITQRGVDPGSFVQNAASGQTMPLLTLDRIDLVTVYMKVK
jgi:multidrug resistance efflux pump